MGLPTERLIHPWPVDCVGCRRLFLHCGFQTRPLYLDNIFVKDALDSWQKRDPMDMTDSEIRRSVGDYLNINNARDIDLKQIEINRKKKRVTVNINYGERIPFMGNVDVVVFNNRYDSLAAQ